MKGKVCLVTGGTSGVGRSIAIGCARQGATVIIVTRDPSRGEAAAGDIRRVAGSERVEWLAADLADLGSVRALAAAFRRRHQSLHVLSLNAAILSWSRRVTAAGHEATFATNYLGHFLLTNLLLDALRTGAPSRIMAVSGLPASLLRVRLDFDDLMLEQGYNPLKATGRAALAKVLFMFELARRLEESGVTANTFHPGLVRSGLPRQLPWPLRVPAAVLMSLLPTTSATGVFLATSPAAEGMTGQFVVGRKPASFEPGYDLAEAASRLWAASEGLVGMS